MTRSPKYSFSPRAVLGNQRGIALVLVLLVVSLLTVMILDFDFRTRLDLRSAGNFRDDTGAYLLADAGVTVASAFLNMDKNGYDDLGEDWAQPWVDQEVVEGHFVTVLVSDEDGKLDLNTLTRAPDGAKQSVRDEADRRVAVVYRLLVEILEVDRERADTMIDSLMDWLDPDDETDGDGAETSYYQTLDPPYRSRDGYLRTLDELGLIRGFDPKMLFRLKDHVTVIWDGVAPTKPELRVNINTASAEVLMALDVEMTDNIASAIIAERQERPFKSRSDTSASGLRVKVNALGQDPATRISGLLRHNSEHFSVLTRGVKGDTRRTVRATLHRPKSSTAKGGVQVTAWRVE